MRQSVLTVVADVDPARCTELEETLARINADPGHNPVLPFARLEQLHFASLVLTRAPGLPTPKLIFEANVDGSVKRWLKALVREARPGIEAVFAGSPGYPVNSGRRRLERWLRDRVVRPRAFHIGATGRSLGRIRHEEALHQAIGAFLDRQEQAGALKGADPASVRAQVQAFVRAAPDLTWATKASGPRETSLERFSHRARAAAVALGVVPFLPVLVPVLLVGWRLLVAQERRDPVQTGPPAPDHVRTLEADEDIGAVGEGDTAQPLAQNHLASLIPVKPGMLRKTLLPVVLFVLNLVTRIKFTKGRLGGIPSIHFAHWALVDDGRHLLFLSNFDGSWESYLADFIDKADLGLTAVWSNTVGFPRTKNLVQGGASDGPRFRQWARCSQCRTHAWYTAYPTLTMKIIDNNSAIREDLFTSLDETETRTWLHRL